MSTSRFHHPTYVWRLHLYLWTSSCPCLVGLVLGISSPNSWTQQPHEPLGIACLIPGMRGSGCWVGSEMTSKTNRILRYELEVTFQRKLVLRKLVPSDPATKRASPGSHKTTLEHPFRHSPCSRSYGLDYVSHTRQTIQNT